MHFPIDKTDAYDERVDRTRAKASEAVASPAMPFPDELTTKQEQEILTPLPYLQAIWNTRDLTFERVVSVMEAYAAALTADKDKEIERLKEDLRVARQTVIAVLGCAEKAEARVTELEAELARLREQVRQTKGEREEGE